ncbi:MAG: HD domain-containing protein [Bacillota bacterium]|nr:HD domain-containing protein [Bacillota bacterium]
MKEMTKLGKILNSSPYQSYINSIAQWEKTRVFCRHDRSHFLDTARVAYILFLTGEVACPELEIFHRDAVREIIYAVGFLHDIGRFLEYEDPTKDHAAESAVLARPLLEDAGFEKIERQLILKAIANHRKKDNQGFDLLIYRADKEGRPCFFCDSLPQCKKFPSGAMPPVKY